jgi:hypothetical protein
MALEEGSSRVESSVVDLLDKGNVVSLEEDLAWAELAMFVWAHSRQPNALTELPPLF